MDIPAQPPQKLFQPPAIGQEISSPRADYFIGQQIGNGNFGTVFECWDEWRNSLVVKIIHPLNRSYDEVRVQWLDELNKLSHLRHPNITYVYDAFEYNDTFYLILEKCNSTLDSLFNIPNFRGDLWLPSVAQSILQAAHFMHVAGYVHKDLHFQNVFLQWAQDPMVPTKDPVLRVKVGDLGISRLESDINIFGTVLAQWMIPPEAINPAEFGLVGRQVDIYHIGLLLLGLLTGQVPTFSKEEIVAGRPRELAESLVSPYAAAIARSLRRHVAARPQSALEFWREIRSAIPAV
jgi:serine/threonine protein kinase